MPAKKDVKVPFPPKDHVQCVLYAGEDKALSKRPSLIFTHGAGGTLQADVILNFAHGFARHAPIFCFQGSLNLISRVRMFGAVIEHQKVPYHLGGRSMGARAAVMAATNRTTNLALVSYPLHTDKETRDQILVDLPNTIKVIFVSGNNDSMCDLKRLQDVRNRMKCKTWLLVVEGADHGMKLRPSAAMREVGEMTGAIVARWLEDGDETAREGKLAWKAEEGSVQWSGWMTQSLLEASEAKINPAKSDFQRQSVGVKRAKSPEQDAKKPVMATKDPQKRQAKRRKPRQ